MTHRIIITKSLDIKKAPRHNSRGPLFDVSYEGLVIVTASTEPCLDGARALRAMGITGKLELWDDLLPYCRLHADIDRAAKLTVREGDAVPRLVKFVSFAPRLALDGVSGHGGTEIALNPKLPSTNSPAPFTRHFAGGAA